MLAAGADRADPEPEQIAGSQPLQRFESMGNRRKQRRQSGDRRSDEHDRANHVPEHDRKRCPRAAGERVTENREHGGTGRQDGAEGNQEEEKPGALRHAASIGIR